MSPLPSPALDRDQPSEAALPTMPSFRGPAHSTTVTVLVQRENTLAQPRASASLDHVDCATEGRDQEHRDCQQYQPMDVSSRDGFSYLVPQDQGRQQRQAGLCQGPQQHAADQPAAPSGIIQRPLEESPRNPGFLVRSTDHAPHTDAGFHRTTSLTEVAWPRPISASLARCPVQRCRAS